MATLARGGFGTRDSFSFVGAGVLLGAAGICEAWMRVAALPGGPACVHGVDAGGGFACSLRCGAGRRLEGGAGGAAAGTDAAGSRCADGAFELATARMNSANGCVDGRGGLAAKTGHGGGDGNKA